MSSNPKPQKDRKLIIQELVANNNMPAAMHHVQQALTEQQIKKCMDEQMQAGKTPKSKKNTQTQPGHQQRGKSYGKSGGGHYQKFSNNGPRKFTKSKRKSTNQQNEEQTDECCCIL